MKSVSYNYIQRLLLLVVFVAAWTYSWAQQVQITDEQGNKIYYTIEADTAVVSLVSFANSENGESEIVIADEVTYNSVVYPVTAIGSQAFYYKTQLGKVTIGSNVKYINPYAFSNCSYLKEVNMGGSVEHIRDYAFNACSEMQSIDLTRVKSIGPYALSRTALTEISMPDVEILQKFVFFECGSLKTVALSNKLNIIPEGCFNNCTALTTVTGGENVTEIGNSAFANCALTSFDFNDKVTTLVRFAFSNCAELQSISGTSAIATLEYGAFYNCKALAGELEFPAITSIEQYTFYYCNALKGVTFGDGLTSLPTYTFYNCGELEYVSLPAGLTQVANYPFSGVNKLKRVYFPGTTMPTFSGNLGLSNYAILYVDKNLREDYKGNNYTKGYRVIDYGATYSFAAKLTTAGTLHTVIADAGLDPANLIELSIEGSINGTDVDFLHSSFPVLMSLDLSKATIVSGGDSYHRWNVENNGTATKNTSYTYNTEDNIVGDYMFYNMPILEKLVLPQNVIKVGKYAVANCPNLAQINPFPSTVKLIDEYAFYKNSHNINCFTEITFGAALDSIARYAFYCSNIEELTIPSSVKYIAEYSFAYNYNQKKVTLPDGLLQIKDNSFAYGQVLKSINLPNSLEVIGGHAFYGCQALDSVCIPSKVKNIGSYAFCYCTGLRKVVLQEGLESIGSSSFNDCRSLEEILFPTSLKSFGSNAFYGCSKIQSVTLPNGITELPSRLFSNCTSLRTVTLGKDISVIGESCFAYCDSLRTIDLEQSSLTKIGSNAFYSCDKLPAVRLSNTITSLGSSAFSACQSLESINIPTAITVVPNTFVAGCTGLTNVILHSGVTEIGYSSFDGCTSLVNLELPENLTTIGSQAFINCSSLKMDKLPDALKYLEPYAFNGCKAISISELPAGLTTLGNNAFGYSGITKMDLSALTNLTTLPMGLFNGADSLKEVKLPSTIKIIDYSAFNGCVSLSGIELPKSLETIESYAFQNCKALEEIEFPESLHTINNSAFAGTGLREVFVPDNVTKLGSSAFFDSDSLRTARLSKNLSYTDYFDYFWLCDSLKSLRIYTETPPKVRENYIGFSDKCTLEVPMDAVELYKTTDYWKDFKAINGFLTNFKLTVSSAGYASLYFDKTLNIPSGVEVYTANRVDGEWLKMQQVTDLLPANTGVIIKAAPGTYKFSFSDEMPDAIEDNMLRGTVTDEYITPPSGSTCYVLSILDGVPGMYRAKLNGEGKFLNNAYKIYMPLSESMQSKGYRFDFDGTTGIENVNTDGVDTDAVYDLQGRKVKMPAKGIYIVNGKKVLIR